jgi:glutamine amidotransferase
VGLRALVLHYGVGNVFSVSHALKRLGVEVIVSEKIVKDVDCMVLPGVGSFSAAAERVAPMRDEIVDMVREGVPTLGICLGMQLFFEESEEGPGRGLGVFGGRVVMLPPSVKRPHMGWSMLYVKRESPLLENVGNTWVYFNHSYHPQPSNPQLVLAEAKHGVDFPAVVGFGTVYGTQFHPEKSSVAGEKILRNFIKIVRG